MTSSITSTPYGISVSRAITRETASDVPSAIADLAAPFRAVYEEMDFYAPLEASPSVVAVLEAYPKLLGLLEVEVAAYVQAYADKCDPSDASEDAVNKTEPWYREELIALRDMIAERIHNVRQFDADQLLALSHLHEKLCREIGLAPSMATPAGKT